MNIGIEDSDNLFFDCSHVVKMLATYNIDGLVLVVFLTYSLISTLIDTYLVLISTVMVSMSNVIGYYA